jgi:16S rRNA (uracil1498-N3)-methyltransferase
VVEPRLAKLDRARRAVIEASKQCGRNQLMRIMGPLDFQALIVGSLAATRVIADRGGSPPLSAPTHDPIALAVGPEGGFSAEELELARARGWRASSFGSSILRVETAAVVGAALLLAPTPSTRE